MVSPRKKGIDAAGWPARIKCTKLYDTVKFAVTGCLPRAQVLDGFWCDTRLPGMDDGRAYVLTTAYDRTMRLWEIDGDVDGV
jgi:hypothetical protein